MLFKFNSASIVIPSSATDEIDIVVILRIYNECEPLFSRIITGIYQDLPSCEL